MKVLHLYSGNLYGGIETLLTTLARHRHRAPQMEPAFGLCFRGRLWDELTAAGVLVHDLGPVRASRPWTVLRARRRLRRVLAADRPDAVVAHSPWPHAVFAPVVRRAGVRLVFAAHNFLARRHWVERWAARTRPDRVIANSHATAATTPTVFPGQVAEVVYYPVAPAPVADPAAARAAVRAELGTAADTVVVLQASRLEWWKGQRVTVAALARLRDVPGWECWVAGGPQMAGEEEYLNELKSAVERGGVADRVRFLGQRSDVTRLMAAADVFCQPNAGPEPFGIVFVEALHAGLPVVTSDFGGAVEIIKEECGVLTAPGDAASVAAALAGLIRDPDRRRALAECGPDRAETLCDPGRQINQLAVAVRGG
ncbi:MAG TPA: glycosyltransferase family 4 protein [Fimbriiglobus sp.]|nr:glycosyltransferase family 4 protein [Fimbriiglobus sp.]